MHLIYVQGWTCSLLPLLLLLFLLCFSNCSRHYTVIITKSLRILSISWLPNCMEIDINQPCSNVLWGLIGSHWISTQNNHTMKPSALLSQRNTTICNSNQVKAFIIFISFLLPIGEMQKARFNWISLQEHQAAVRLIQQSLCYLVIHLKLVPGSKPIVTKSLLTLYSYHIG